MKKCILSADMNYPRARATVGFIALTVLSLGSLLLLLSPLGTALASSLSSPYMTACVLIGIWWLVSIPFDFLAGYWLPQRHARITISWQQWGVRWARASIAHSLLMGLFLMMLVSATRWLGFLGAMGCLFLVMLLLLGFQMYLHIGFTWAKQHMENNQGRLLFLVEHEDRGFTGGIFGIPGKESLVYPKYWRERLDQSANQLLTARRHGAINTGAHGRGVLVAIGWNLLLFALSLLISPALPNTSIGLLGTVSAFSLLSLLTPLGLLPWLSRKAVYEVDRWTYLKGMDPDALRRGLHHTQRLRTDEGFPLLVQSRPPLATWEQAFASQKEAKGAWNTVGYALFTSWAGGNLIARAFPNLLGRPELWVFTPSE